MLNKAAYYDANTGSFVLTPVQRNARGSVVYARPVLVDDFTASFDFRISGGTGGDGLAIMLETDGPNAIGEGGAGLGIAGLHGFAVEFDTYNNLVCGDVDDNHVGLDVLDACKSLFTVSPTSLAAAHASVKLDDGQWHSVKIAVNGGFITFTLDNAMGMVQRNVRGIFPKSYYIGFAASTGGETNRHEVRNFKAVFPSSRCL